MTKLTFDKGKVGSRKRKGCWNGRGTTLVAKGVLRPRYHAHVRKLAISAPRDYVIKKDRAILPGKSEMLPGVCESLTHEILVRRRNGLLGCDNHMRCGHQDSGLTHGITGSYRRC